MANSLRSRPANASHSCHSRSVTWLTAGETQHARAARIAEGRFDVARAQAAGVHLHGELLQLGRPTGEPRRTRDTKGSARS